jgi:hypothetical protein
MSISSRQSGHSWSSWDRSNGKNQPTCVGRVISVNTYCFIVTPVRVLYTRKDARFGLHRCDTGLESGSGQGRLGGGSGGHCLSTCWTTRSRNEKTAILFNNTLAASDWEGEAETRRTNSRAPRRRPGADHWCTKKFPRSKSHGPL